MASSSRASAGLMARRAVPDFRMANATTSAVPVAAQNQKPADGRWRCSHAPTAAVASGSTPTITLACTASTWRIAMEVHSGKPNTTPPATKARGRHWSRRGKGALVASRNTADSRPATTARPSAMNTPDICGASGVPTARRVMGRVSAKMATPSRPSHRPRRWSALACILTRALSSAGVGAAVNGVFKDVFIASPSSLPSPPKSQPSPG